MKNNLSIRHTAFLILAGLLVLAVAIISIRAARAVSLARQLNESSQTLLREAVALRDAEDITASVETIRSELAKAQNLVVDLRRTIWPFGRLLRTFGWVPVYGDDLTAVPHLLDLADALLACARSLDAVYTPLLEQISSERPWDQDFLAGATELITEANQSLVDLRRDVEAAHQARSQIGDIEGLSSWLQAAVTKADRVLALLDQSLIILEALPPLLGADHPHHVLILLQNADEIRPTGGWITSTAYLVVSRGRIAEITVLDSSDPTIDLYHTLHYEEPPFPMRDYMHLPIWAFRDANWSPDFPTSAAKAVQLYISARDVPVDTVLAINQYTFSDFLAATGPITLEDGTVINAGNAADRFRDLWTEYVREQGSQGRKDFIAELAPILLTRSLSIDSREEALSRWEASQRAASRGDLLAYSTDPAIQRLAEYLDWDGSLPQERSDYLYVVDSNIGMNKTDMNVERQVSYHVSLTDPANPYSLLELEYTNRSAGVYGRACPTGANSQTYEDIADDCYVDFLRLYLPDNTQVLQVPRFEFPAEFTHTQDASAGVVHALFDEGGKEVYGGLMVIPAGETLATSFTYMLPPEMIFARAPGGAITYTLLVEKQPGVPAYPVSITVDLPFGGVVTGVTPEPTYADARTLYFETMLRADIHVHLEITVPDSILQPVSDMLPPETTPVPYPTPRILPTGAPLPTLIPSPTAMPTLTSTPTPTFAPVEVELTVRTILREGPGSHYTPITTYSEGERVLVLGRDSSGQWFFVRTSRGQQGWMSAELLTGLPEDATTLPVMINTPTPAATPTPRQ